MPSEATWPSARAVVDELQALASAAELVKVRRRLQPDEPAIGVRMKHVFDVARSATGMSVEQWEHLVAEPTYEARMVAFSILDFQARLDLGSRSLRDTYLGHHDRITTWDMVDRAAPRVVGAAVARGPYTSCTSSPPRPTPSAAARPSPPRCGSPAMERRRT